jgi:transcriptional regulator with XRE-family HTH domain
MEDRIRALQAQGLSVRKIADALGLSKSAVQRLATSAVSVGSEGGRFAKTRAMFYPGAALVAEAQDALNRAGVPVWAVEVAAYLDVSVDDVVAGLNELQVYRLQGLFSRRAAGLAWADPKSVVEAMPRHVKDATIVRLRKQGKTLAQIGKALVPQMSEGGVSKALLRLEDALSDDDFDDEPAPRARGVKGSGEVW